MSKSYIVVYGYQLPEFFLPAKDAGWYLISRTGNKFKIEYGPCSSYSEAFRKSKTLEYIRS